MKKLPQGVELIRRATELGISPMKYINNLARPVDEAELQRLVMEAENHLVTAAPDPKDLAPVISSPLPKDEKGLEVRLQKLFEYLATNARSANESAESVLTKARIEQTRYNLGLLEGRRMSKREWWAFAIGAAGVAVAALAVILK